MFYKEDGKLTYRDFMIDNEMRYEDLDAWQNALVEAISVEIKYTKGVDRDMIISG